MLWIHRKGEQYTATNKICTFVMENNIKININ
jgi:hypothetical protein